MTETVTLQLPAELVERARAEGARTSRRVEEVLADWASRSGAASPEALSDEEVLARCDVQMPEAEQHQMSELLWRQREGHLSEADRPRLQELLEIYRRGLLGKAEALRLAVARGLRPPLGEP
jgi:hypothetical protein